MMACGDVYNAIHMWGNCFFCVAAFFVTVACYCNASSMFGRGCFFFLKRVNVCVCMFIFNGCLVLEFWHCNIIMFFCVRCSLLIVWFVAVFLTTLGFVFKSLSCAAI